MKKRIVLVLCVAMLMSSIAVPGVGAEAAKDAKDEEEGSIIETIQADFNSTIDLLESELEKLYTDVGKTYEDYTKNKGYITDWYDTCQTEAEELYERTYDAAIEYYKFVADTVDHDDYNAVDDALDVFYDEIIDDALDDFYDEIIDDAMDDIYDKYDKITDESDDWDAWSDMYKEWSSAWSDMYRAWSDAWSEEYHLWSDIWTEFALHENFDVEAILEEIENNNEETESDESTSNEDEETFVESSERDEVFIEPFNTDPTIEETVLWDEDDIKVTATSLDYNSWSAILNLTIENKSDRTLDFANGSTGFCWYAINGYSIEDGFYSDKAEPGETVEVSPSFSTSILSAYGINEIAEIKMRFYYCDDDYNYVYFDERTLETTAADSYDFETDTYQESLNDGTLARLFDGTIDYLAFDELYASNDISMVSEALLSIDYDDEEEIGLMLEMVNDSDHDIYAVISNVYLNGELAYDYIWDDMTMMPGTRGLLDLDLTALSERRSRYDDDVEPIDLSDGVDSITFTLSIKNTNYEDALTPQEITINFND